MARSPADSVQRKLVLLRVGIDAGSGGIQGPLFEDGRFEYVPIPDSLSSDPRTYGTTPGRYGRLLIDYFPPRMRARMRESRIHADPEFDTYTYGDPTPPKASLRRLSPADLLVFYCGLQGYGWNSPPALYLLGYFEVAKAGLAPSLRQEEIERDFAGNAHVRNRDRRPGEWTRLVLVKGGPGSRRYQRAHKISIIGQDRAGKPLKVLAPEMQAVFGDFGGHLSMQRSPPRWVASPYVQRAAEFVRSLA